MAGAQVTTKDTYIRRKKKSVRNWYQHPWLWLAAVLVIIAITVTSVKIITAPPVSAEAPETAKVLRAQESMGNFGILIPAYLPKGFDRENMEISVEQSGPSGEPAADLVYRSGDDIALFIREWIPTHPELETLSGSRPIETKWGKGWLLTQTTNLICVWVDVGQLRVSMTTHNLEVMTREQLVLAAETLGLASNSQSFSYAPVVPQIRDIVPPPPFEVQLNASGVQELNLTITPGGYTPIRFAVKKGIPVKVNFRALGEVGCGNVLLLPTSPEKYAALTVSKQQPLDTIEFTPQTAGEFEFYCTSNHYRGIMTVREP